ncbi:hypothetical protein GEV01_20045 [Rugamonas sp. FT103W]|uniref:Uncharacterized protein n=2 Tax=Rugamonas rivuli TaxID=2743358 RepID=A0A843SNG2_9BURK|nr:hypothetical protein [Rugamonas rivuli]
MIVQLPTDTLLKLIEKPHRRGGSQDISEAMTKAIECWLEDPARFAPGADPEGLHGYQWKTLFLPEGTILKSWSHGENNYARVEGDKTFKIACRLRDELAAASKAPAASTPAPVATAPMPAALPAPPSAATPPRNTDSAPGWELPERRKFRYRLEDVAY